MSRLLGCLLLLVAIPASAATNLAATCARTTAIGTTSCGDAWYFKAPAGTIVQSNGKWALFDSLPLTAPVLVCRQDIPAGSTQCLKTEQVSVLKSVLVPATTPTPTSTERITWDPPTRYVSGQTLGGGDPAAYNLKCGQAAGGPYTVVQRVSKSITPPATRVSATAPPVAGIWYCIVTTVGVNGTESPPSNEVSRKVVAAPVIE